MIIIVFGVTTIALVFFSWFFPAFPMVRTTSGLLGFITGMAYVIDGLAETRKHICGIAMGILWMLVYAFVVVF